MVSYFKIIACCLILISLQIRAQLTIQKLKSHSWKTENVFYFDGCKKPADTVVFSSECLKRNNCGSFPTRISFYQRNNDSLKTYQIIGGHCEIWVADERLYTYKIKTEGKAQYLFFYYKGGLFCRLRYLKTTKEKLRCRDSEVDHESKVFDKEAVLLYFKVER